VRPHSYEHPDVPFDQQEHSKLLGHEVASGAVERKRISSAQATEMQRHLAVACFGFVAFVCSKSNS
jgi:hypothetical protein